MAKNDKIFGTSTRPRVCINRTNTKISAQAIDDDKGITLFAVSTASVDNKKAKPVEKALEVGKTLASMLKKAKITEIVFDRNNLRYHGQIKAFAEGIRSGEIKF